VNEILTWLLDVVQNVDPVLRTILAGVAVMLETSVLVGLIVPGDTMVIVAGTAIASPLEGVILASAVVVGALLGESGGFWLGRYFGPRIRASKLGQKLGERNWERADRYLRRRGGPAIFLSRFLPVLHSLVPLTVGMSVGRGSGSVGFGPMPASTGRSAPPEQAAMPAVTATASDRPAKRGTCT